MLPGGVTVEQTRGGVVLRTGDLQLTVSALLEWANHHDLRLHQFKAQAASLQETFLAVAESGDDQHDEEWVAMTTTTRPVPAALQRLRGSARRIGALSRAEALLLRRNPMALLTALGTPLIGVVLLNAFPATGSVPLPGASIVVTVTAFALLFPLYYNLVTTLVARREELVLKRLRSGECSDSEILIGAGAPAMTIAWGQTIIGVVAATACWSEWPSRSTRRWSSVRCCWAPWCSCCSPRPAPR